MKTSTMRLTIATAALMAAVGSASAQTLNADIPVYFHVGKAVMTPGSYQIETDTGFASKLILLRNLSTHTSVLLATSVRADAPKDWVAEGTPKLRFECVGDACALRSMWNGPGSDAYVFPARKGPAPDFEARRNTVVVSMIKVH